MNDRTLIKISLAWSLVGIFVLILVADRAQLDQIEIKDLESNIGKTVSLQGEVLKVSARESATFIDLKDKSGTTTIVDFNKLQNITVRDEIIAVGKVQTYRGDTELIASEIKLIVHATKPIAAQSNGT